MKLKTTYLNVNSIYKALLACVVGFLVSGLILNASAKDLPLLKATYIVEVKVQSTHVSENTTSTSWRPVLRTEWREFAEWYHESLWEEFIVQGDVFHLLFEPSPVYDESVIDIRLRTQPVQFRGKLSR